jgi:hypothetical protein
VSSELHLLQTIRRTRRNVKCIAFVRSAELGQVSSNGTSSGDISLTEDEGLAVLPLPVHLSGLQQALFSAAREAWGSEVSQPPQGFLLQMLQWQPTSVLLTAQKFESLRPTGDKRVDKRVDVRNGVTNA